MDPSGRRRRLIVRGSALVVLVAAWVAMRFRRRALIAPRLSYAPMAERDVERQNNLMFIYETDDTRCVDLLRMRREPFFQLCDMFRTRGLLRDSLHMVIEEQVAMFLHVVGHNQRFRVIGLTFRRSIETISRIFQEVLYAVGELRDDMIQPPSTNIPTKILHSSRWNPFFKDCIGAIDGTHVLSRVPAAHKAAFLGRKHTTTQNVLAAVDFDLRFTYVLAGWEGSAHDALILADAIERNDGLSVPQDKYYLVDAGYACNPGFLPPFRATGYHLREFGTRRPQTPKELFNLRHSSLRVTVERAFGALKNRFKILYNKPFHPYKTQVKLVLACCLPCPNLKAMAEGNLNPNHDPMGEGAEDQPPAAAAAAVSRIVWTPAMSGFALRRFVSLCEDGLRTDKGFKDVHLNSVARDISDFIGRDISGNQVYNHLRKWRAKWVKISQLKELSGALWDPENFMITLEAEHYKGHCQAHAKDAEFLNTPLANYTAMETIFGSGVATGRYAMGSSEPLGQPIDLENYVDLDGYFSQGAKDKGKSPEVPETKPKGESSHLGKRKRDKERAQENEAAMIGGLTEAVWGFVAAVNAGNHNEGTPGLYCAVMDMPVFPREALMVALNHLTENKASSLLFVEMTLEDRDLWLRTFLAKAYYI